MAVKPLEDRILVRPLEADDKTESGIYLPESAKEKPIRGTVVAMGPGRLLDNGERVSPSVKNGDVVVYSKYAGTEVEIKNENHLIIRESELLGVIE
ncbi:MAG: co-chaperone GroES [Planctomycetota bacterium]|nr:co-chaperone GroES [Planctomycetota bacterium]